MEGEIQPEEIDVVPSVNKHRYSCPHCGIFAVMDVGKLFLRFNASAHNLEGWTGHRCTACERLILWEEHSSGTAMVHPIGSIGEKPNKDMPSEVREVYEEARRVGGLSPRSAAALLRLALQLLADHIEPGSGDINAKIGALVRRGLHPQTQQAMDVLRIVGNNAVHPGQINIGEDPDLLPGLFRLVNVIVDQMISIPQHAASLFSALPQRARDQVVRRDSAGPASP